jgi:3-methyladenine DNA glycosylase AlkC
MRTIRRIVKPQPSMAEPFKNLLNPATVRAAAAHLHRAWPGFDGQRFSALALDGLDALEMKSRAMQIAAALQATLPADFSHAADTIEASLAPPLPDEQNVAQPRDHSLGLSGWVIWPLGEFVARAGLAHPARALRVLHALTQRLTAEWAIRLFILHCPDETWPTLARWTTDPSPHVRRLVSEGSRPRLPWGMQLKGLIADPSPTLPLLEALQDDQSPYVRRSVANHLNDIGKDHPALVADWIARHLVDATPQREALLRHAGRTLIKQGDASVLGAFGQGRPLQGRATLRVSPKRAAVGGELLLDATIESQHDAAQPLVIDYAVHHVKANGSTSAKVFKGRQVVLEAGQRLVWQKRHSLKVITTRRYFSGEHRVELRINGQTAAEAVFRLRADD